MPDEKQQGDEPEINAVPVNLADIVEDEDAPGEEPSVEEEADIVAEQALEAEEADEADEAEGDEGDEAEEKEESDGLGGLMDDIFAEEQEEDDRMKAFGDLELLTMNEISSEVEAVLEELSLRQGADE